MTKTIRERKTIKKIVDEDVIIGFDCEYCGDRYQHLPDAEKCERLCLQKLQKVCKHDIEHVFYEAYHSDNPSAYSPLPYNNLIITKECRKCKSQLERIYIDATEDPTLIQEFIDLYNKREGGE